MQFRDLGEAVVLTPGITFTKMCSYPNLFRMTQELGWCQSDFFGTIRTALTLLRGPECVRTIALHLL